MTSCPTFVFSEMEISLVGVAKNPGKKGERETFDRLRSFTTFAMLAKQNRLLSKYPKKSRVYPEKWDSNP